MYTCNGTVEFHSNEDSKEEFLKVFKSGAPFKVFGSWQDPTCYLYRLTSCGTQEGGWLLKRGYTIEKAIEFLFNKKPCA